MSSNKKHKVLIVDDDKMNIIALAQFLKSSYDVIVAVNGETAISEAQKHNPDIIILDVIMPDISGFEVIQKLKSDVATAHIPVIFITGLESESDEEKGLALGAADYITKPFHRALTLKRVATHLKLAELSKQQSVL